MNVTVAIPTTLERSGVRRTVESAIASASRCGDDSEVLVVANGDRSRAPLENIGSPLLRVVHQERRSAPGARNLALETARHDTLMFTDDDCVIPETWCSDIQDALTRQGWAAVAAPVRISIRGLVTSFIDYQRIFDAPPETSDETRYLITASCGLRRDAIPCGFRFDDVNFNNAAEDADFGYRLRDAGIAIGWLGATDPVLHTLNESTEEITERFLRYGRANARLYARKRRWEESVPGVLDWYAALVAGTSDDFRRFDEFVDREVREAFTVYELMLTASFLIGYLDELGNEVDYPLVNVDYQRLHEGWQQATRGLQAEISETPCIDFSRLGRRSESRGAIPAWLPALLRECAPPVPTTPPAHAVSVINANLKDFTALQDGIRHRITVLRHELTEDDLHSISVHELAHRFRRSAVAFNEGCHELERMRYNEREMSWKVPDAK